MVFPSRWAPFVFVRILSVGAESYQCPHCIYRGRVPSASVARRSRTGIRHYGQTSTKNETPDIDERHGSFLDFQLSRRHDVGARIPVDSLNTESSSVKKSHVTRKYIQKQLEHVDTRLEMTGLNIEELEDMLLDMSSKNVIYTDKEDIQKDSRTWHLREKGDISEDENSSIEALLDNYQSQPKTRRSKTIPSHTPEVKVDIIPWYLREQQSDTSLTPVIDIQQTQYEKYPDLPRNSPPLLQPMISRLFYDHHLQNIVLIDLRNRDPPPVWGSNTIMILATVRSERQLSSVAEATSKWLKATAGVIPRTDGLPKQENLVMKRRRLRKKSLRRPGYLMAAPRPVTWVSMNTGYQGLVLQLFTEQGRQEYDLEGLWSDAKVVDAEILDMKPRKVRPGRFDEDERVETSLPSSKSQKKTVLQKKLEKERKKWEKMKEAKAAKRRWTKEEKDQGRQRRMQEAAIFNSSGNASFTARAYFGDRQQRRQMHTIHRTNDGDESKALPPMPSLPTHLPSGKYAAPPQLRWKTTNPGMQMRKHAAWWNESQFTLPGVADTILPSSVRPQILDALKNQPPFQARDDATDFIARTISLQGDRNIAEKLSNLSASNDPAALKLLAHFGHLSRFIKNSQSPTRDENHWKTYKFDPFPEQGIGWAFDFFLRDMPIRPNADHWRLAILFYLNLGMVAPTNFRTRRILDILLLPVSQGITIPRSTFHLILNHIAVSSPEHRNNEVEANDFSVFNSNLHRRLHAMNSILQCMKSDFGYEYLNDGEVYLALFKACCQPFLTLNELVHDIDLPIPKHYSDLRRLSIVVQLQNRIPVTPEFFVLLLLQFAHMHKWRSFLKRWRWPLTAGIGKDTDMWTVFWACLARGRNEYYIRMALKDHYDEMINEGNQLVLNKAIAIGLAKCCEIVDPEDNEFKSQRRMANTLLASSRQA